MLLGCIADDITGATDLALMLVRSGMSTVQVMGVPSDLASLAKYDAVVVAMKSRTIAPQEAVRASVSAARALRDGGARQLFFKYCSTFDSTDQGNIGPVTDALLDELGADFTIACPAFPENGRTVYLGHLFVLGELLAESPMKDHPLTPMRDSNLVRVLANQSRSAVGLVDYESVEAGPAAIREAMRAERETGKRVAIVDALNERHLRDIGTAASDLQLITGGSGVALGLAQNFAAEKLLELKPVPRRMRAPPGRCAILAGSCSAATRAQVRNACDQGLSAFRLDPLELAAGPEHMEQASAWAFAELESDRIPLIYSSSEPERVTQAQQKLGREQAGAIVEQGLAELSSRLLGRGVSRIVVAGGETSGAVLERLDVRALQIGPEIDAGVPWTLCLDGPEVVLALKSGNFGAEDFFTKAWRLLD